MTPVQIGVGYLINIAEAGHRLVSNRGTALLLVTAVSCLAWITRGAPDHGHNAAIMAAVFVASLVGSIAGFAFSAVAGGMLFHLQDDPVHIVAIMITCSIANQVKMTWALRRSIEWRPLWRYFAGGAPGLAIGIWVLLHADRTMYTRLLGGFLVAYGAYMLLRKPAVIHRQPAAVDIVTGLLGGVTGGAAGFPGAFVTIWCGMKGWDKARQRAVVQPYILVMQLAGLLAISLLQPAHTGRGALEPGDLIFIPVSLLGTSAGLALYGRLTDVQFGRAVNLLLIVSGLSFIL